MGFIPVYLHSNYGEVGEENLTFYLPNFIAEKTEVQRLWLHCRGHTVSTCPGGARIQELRPKLVLWPKLHLLKDPRPCRLTWHTALSLSVMPLTWEIPEDRGQVGFILVSVLGLAWRSWMDG